MAPRIGIVAVLVGFLGACATPEIQSPPPNPSSAQHSLGRIAALDQTNHMTGHLNDERTILFFQNFGGGGAGLGILAGPFGVMANVSMIEEVTKQEMAKLSGRLGLDPVQAFKEVAAKDGFRISDPVPNGAVILSPYLYVTKPNPETFAFAAALLVEYEGVDPKWTGKYMQQLPLTLRSEAVRDGLGGDQLAALKADMTAGMQGVLRLYAADTAKTLSTVRKIKVKSDFLTPRFTVEVPGDEVAAPGTRVTFRTFGGVYSLDPGTAEISAQ